MHHRGVLGITGNPDTPNGLVFTDQNGRVIASAGTPAPPGAPPTQAATAAGYPWTAYTHPTGERLQTKWIDFGPPYLN